MVVRVNPHCEKRPTANANQAASLTRSARCQLAPQNLPGWQPGGRVSQAGQHPGHAKPSPNQAFMLSERPTNLRVKYKIDASTNTIPVTRNSRAVACARIQMIATIASAGTIFIPGKLKGSPSERTLRCTNTQQAAQQSRYISNTATFESTASFSNVPLIESTNASV